MTANDIVAAHVASEAGNCTILAGGAEGRNEQVLNQVRGGLGPSIVAIRAQLHRAGAEDDAIVAKEMRSGDATDQKRDGVTGGSLRSRHGPGIENIVLHGERRSASRQAD